MSTRPVPTNLDNWPGVTDLVISYKHLLYVLWSSPGQIVSVIGVGRPGIIERLCGASRLDEPVVLEALRELHRRGLVHLDERTREVAIRRWCRFHRFDAKWARAVETARQEIESDEIKAVLNRHEGVNDLFPLKSKCASPNTNVNVNINTTTTRRPPPPEWLEAADIEIENAEKLRPVVNRGGLAKKILERYWLNGGPDAGITKQLEARRQQAERERQQREVAEMKPTELEAARQKCAKAKSAFYCGTVDQARTV